MVKKKKIIKKVIKKSKANNKPVKGIQTPQKNQKTPVKEIPTIDRIQDEKLKETVSMLKHLDFDINYNPKLTDPLEVEEHFKEEIENYLNEKYNDVRERASELRKDGYDEPTWNFKLMSIPLKIKVFLATGDKKDFNNVTHRLNEVLKEVIEFEKKKKAKDAMKELRERKKEQAEKLKKNSKKLDNKKNKKIVKKIVQK